MQFTPKLKLPRPEPNDNHNLANHQLLVDRIEQNAASIADVADLRSKSIAESGKNSNGDYLRFADGTQICFLRYNETVRSFLSSNLSGLYFTNLETRTFPASFVENPSINLTILGSNIVSIKGQNLTSIWYTPRIYSTLNAEVEPIIYMTAIGRWK